MAIDDKHDLGPQKNGDMPVHTTSFCNNQRLKPPWLARRVSSPAAHLHSPGLPLRRRLGLVGLLAEVRMGEGAPKKGPS